VPPEFWERTDVYAALQAGDIADLFQLLNRRVGISQTAIGNAIGQSQPVVSAIMRRKRQVIAFDFFKQIADGLHMPDHARMTFGLAPTGSPSQLVTPPRRPASATHPELEPTTHSRYAPSNGMGDLLARATVLADHSAAQPVANEADYQRLVEELVEWARVNNRRDVLRLLTQAASAVVAGPALPIIDTDEQPAAALVLHHSNDHSDHAFGDPAEWLAWQMWRHREQTFDQSSVAPQFRPFLDAHPHVILGSDGFYRFTDPALIDVLVAQCIFYKLRDGDGYLLATAQTSHATDLRLGTLSRDDALARRELTTWMSNGPTPIVRVNAAGILAKVGVDDLSDAVIATLRTDPETRHLYLSAVASRALGITWDDAARLAFEAVAQSEPQIQIRGRALNDGTTRQLVNELSNPRDPAARWCSAVLLSLATHSDTGIIHAALSKAARIEPCRENLRAYAAVLGGAHPVG
jgi:hypothetical protein